MEIYEFLIDETPENSTNPTNSQTLSCEQWGKLQNENKLLKKENQFLSEEWRKLRTKVDKLSLILKARKM